MKSCVVGIGAMGLEMALHIQNKGMDVVGVDLDQKQVAEAKQRGLSAGEDLVSQISGIDVFIVIVATDKQTESVVETILANNPKKGAAVVVAATNHPDTMNALAAKCAESGVRFVDAPVVFGMQGARDGNLASLCGGSEDDVSYVTPVLMCYSRAVHLSLIHI